VAARWAPDCRQPEGPRHPHLGALGSIPRTASPVARRIDERIASRRELVDGGKPAVPKTHPTVAVLYHASPASFIPREGVGRLRAITGLGLRSAPVPRRSELTDLVSSTPAAPTATS